MYRIKITQDQDLVMQYAYKLHENLSEFSYHKRDYDDNFYFTIPIGETIINYKNVLVTFVIIEYPDIKAVRDKTVKHNELYMQFDSESKQSAIKLVQDFILEANKFYNEKKSDEKVNVYTYSHGWFSTYKLFKRPMDTIYIDKIEKIKFINDIESYLKKEDLYFKFAIPNKRIYLLSGLPGTGKSSLILATASMLSRHIAIINFGPGFTDENLLSAVQTIPEKSILVFEDIDTLFIDRTTSTTTNKSAVSFSAFLNIFDGIFRKEPMIVIITTNYQEKLDKALLRPGRVDYIMKFDIIKKPEIEEMFCKFLPNQTSNFNQFYKELSKYKFSAALLQKFLFDNIECKNILDKIPELLELIRTFNEKELNMYI